MREKVNTIKMDEKVCCTVEEEDKELQRPKED